MPILDNAVMIGKESTYATAVTVTRGYEVQSDAFKLAPVYLESKGMRGGAHTQRSDRSRRIDMGGTGSIKCDILSQGFGLIAQSMFGTVATALVSGTVNEHTFATAAADPDDSFTVEFARDMAGTNQRFTHSGCVTTGWTISQDVGGLLMADIAMDVATVATAGSVTTAAYPAAANPFDWTQCVATWNGVTLDLQKFSLTAALGLNTDRRALRGTATKKKPIRMSVPMFTGSFSHDFEALTGTAPNSTYADFLSGTPGPLELTWTGSTIEASTERVVITMPLVQLHSGSPEASLSATTNQSVDFKVLHGASAAITMKCRQLTSTL